MVKSIIKEILIIVFLIAAILLILSILFYKYRPSTYKIPTAVETYSLPEEMTIELNETIQAANRQNIVKTYSVDGGDLEGYKQSKDYDQGKIDPFAKYSTNTNGTIQNGTSTENNTDETPQNGTGTQGSFLNTVK